MVGKTIRFSPKDLRIGKIIDRVGLIVSAGKGVLKRVKSSDQGSQSSSRKSAIPQTRELAQANSSKKALRLGAAIIGLTAIGYGIFSLVLAAKKLAHLRVNEDQLFLVSHDNKPSQESKGSLPRLGVVNSQTGGYQEVLLNNNALSKAKDLESLKWVKQNEYLTCESAGHCFYFSINRNEKGEYLATILKQFKLHVPLDKFYNIEGVALKGAQNSEICWSHRGGIFAGEEPWTRCASLDLDEGKVGGFSETAVDDPFAISNKLNRAISDHAIGQKTGKDYFIATIDTEGSEGIQATTDQAYSFLYTKDSCLKLFPGDKVEALHMNPDETCAIIATDNEAAGSKICQYSLESGELSCVDIRAGQEYGIGGIAPLKI